MFFVIQVHPKGESKFTAIASRRMADSDLQVFWPRRRLSIRRRGHVRNTLAPIFPGYVFVETETLSPELYWKCKRVPGFSHFLRSNDDIVPLSPDDQKLLQHFLSFGQVVDRSIASFDADRRIRIISGPLKGLEGLIVRVDRRKGRAKVKLDLYEESYYIDFGFESLEPGPAGEPEPQGDLANRGASSRDET